jgi:chitin synthase
MVIMLAVSVFAVVKEAERFGRDGGSFFGYAKDHPAFRDLVISVVTTYGVYLLSSLLHLDPWHCFTSMPSYLLLLPSYVNILMIYAFCNIHDTTWGTKGGIRIT